MARDDHPEASVSALKSTHQASSFTAEPVADYRPGAGIVLLNGEGQVFLGRRAYLSEEAWQMPQGGIDPGEQPKEAALRELQEEVGIDDAQIIAESEHWLRYDVPPSLAPPSWGGRWKGQCQKWFAMRFSGDDRTINLEAAYPEFDGWRWMPSDAVVDLAVPFKREVYRAVLSEFHSIIRNP